MSKAVWYFTTEGEKIILRARFEGEDGTIGDAFDEIRPGEKALNLTYQELRDPGAGAIIIENKRARIVSGEFCIIDEDGEPTDRELHAAILGDPEL